MLGYDADGNMTSRKTRANQTITFAYDTLNRLVTKTPPAPVPVVSYGYDLAGRLTSVSDTSAAMTAPSGSASYATNVTYDQLNRPLSVNWSPASGQTAATAGSSTFNYGYDATNRRVSQSATDNSWWFYPTTASTVSYTANALNQYTGVGAVIPTYDGNGNLTGDGTFTYGYDAENRLTSAGGAGNTITYAYNGQGRRKLKTVNGTTTVFVTDTDNREVLEYDGTSGQILRWYAYGLGSNDVLNQMDVVANTRTTLIPDIQGSVIGSIDSASGALSKRGYLPYGASASAAGTFAYTAQRIDPETNGLYYYRARMYTPAWGRFMQVDPVGYQGGDSFPDTQSWMPGTSNPNSGALILPGDTLSSRNPTLPTNAGMSGLRYAAPTQGAWGRLTQPEPIAYDANANLYIYVGNDPLNRVDPTGLVSDTPTSNLLLVATKGSPTFFCQNVECGAPTGGVVYPLCPTCNNRLRNGGPPILLENGRIITLPIEPR